MKEALLRMVKAARKCQKLDALHMELGYDNTPYFDLYGEIVDAIYSMIGENTQTLEESVTWEVLHDESLTDEERVDRLLASSATLKLIQHAAAKRNMGYGKLIKLILGEWAINQGRMQASR